MLYNKVNQLHVHIYLLPLGPLCPSTDEWVKKMGHTYRQWDIQFTRSVVSDSLWPHGLQHATPPCPSQTPRAHLNSCWLSRWCHPTISSSVVPFSSCFQSFPASGSFPTSQFFTSGGQSNGTSTSASVLPMSIQVWFSLGLAGLISLQFKRLSRVFSNTTVWKHQFFSVQLSLFIVQLSHPYMTTGKTIVLTRWTFAGKVMSLFFNTLSRLVITFLPRSKYLLISWLQAPSAVILEPKKMKSVTASLFPHLFDMTWWDQMAWTMENYSFTKRNGIGSFVETLMDLEIIVPSEVSQAKFSLEGIDQKWLEPWPTALPSHWMWSSLTRTCPWLPPCFSGWGSPKKNLTFLRKLKQTRKELMAGDCQLFTVLAPEQRLGVLMDTSACLPLELYNFLVQFSSVTQSCPTLCDPMNHSTPGLPVHHQLPEFTHTHVHRVSDAIQPSHPLSSLSPPASNPSQHQSLYQWVNSSHEVAKVLEFQL